MTTSYLEQLLDKCDSLKLVLNPPHPGAFIQGRADQAQILLAELEQEISEIERQDAPTFETVELKEKLYDNDSGKCFYCGKDTLWGDAPHTENCAAFQELKELDSKGYDWDGLIWIGFEPYVDTKWQDWLNTMEVESRAFEDELIASLGMTDNERGIE